MQREEVQVSLGPYLIRLLQRPAQVPPEAIAGEVTTTPNCLATEIACTAHRSSASSANPAQQLFKPSDCLLGWELWPAAWRLAEYLTSRQGSELVRGAAAVVELGAGLGLPGIVAAKVGARSVILTDLPQALPLAAANIELNSVSSACRTAVLDWAVVAAASATAPGEAVVAAAADGENGCNDAVPLSTVPASPAGAGQGDCRDGDGDGTAGCSGGGGDGQHLGQYDVVLAADVVYVSAMAPLLADTVAAVCRRPSATVLVGHTVRKSVWLDRTTGAVCVDATDEPWEAFVARMTSVHGFSCKRADSCGVICTSGPSDTFVCAFTRCGLPPHQATD